MAMYGSLATAEERMLELVERYGKDELRGYLSELQKLRRTAYAGGDSRHSERHVLG